MYVFSCNAAKRPGRIMVSDIIIIPRAYIYMPLIILSIILLILHNSEYFLKYNNIGDIP